jgi:ABC-type uncharacterized transport system permease subunit
MIYVALFVIKIMDNIILTAKSILQYRGARIASTILVVISQLLFYFVVAKVVEDKSMATIIIIAIASGIGNLIAFPIIDKCKKDDKWQFHLTSSDVDDIMKLCNYLVQHNIKYLANHGINRKGKETINVIAYSKTKEQSRLIEKYLAETKSKYLKEINR